MVDYKSKIYTEEEGQIQGIEVKIFSEQGDRIKTLHVTAEEDINALREEISNLGDVYVKFTNLERALDDVTVNAQTLDNLSSTDFAREGHSHADIYAQKDHAVASSVHGLGTTTKYGHNKVINNLNAQTANDGESLSAYQGKVLADMIRNEVQKLTTWTTQKVGSYGTLKINTQLRCCQFNYTRVNYTLNGDKDLHSNYIPVAYRPSGVVRQPVSKYTILVVGSNGDISLRTTYPKATKTNLSANFIWFY